LRGGGWGGAVQGLDELLRLLWFCGTGMMQKSKSPNTHASFTTAADVPKVMHSFFSDCTLLDFNQPLNIPTPLPHLRFPHVDVR